MIRAGRLIASTGAVLALAGSAWAAQEIAGRDRAPATAVVTISSTAPLFTASGLVGGEQMERCTVLRNEGPQPADVTLFGSAEENDLSPWLNVELVRGTLPDGEPAGNCAGFVADAADYGAGTPGVVYRGTLAALPDAATGIADPTRWAVGEQHAYLLRVTYTGQNPQQGLRTVQSFHWGVTPFDDRPPENFRDPSDAPTPTLAAGGTGAAGDGGTAPARQCTVVSLGPGRPYIGARAIRAKAVPSRKETKRAATRSAMLEELGLSAGDVVAGDEDLSTLSTDELRRRAQLLQATRTARRTPVMVVRITQGKGNTVSLRVALRKNGKTLSPRRWRWVRLRVNATATKSTVRWPFVSTAKVSQLKTGYNQIDLTLNRGRKGDRINGLPRLVRRSFAFVVRGSSGATDCVLG